MRLTKLSLTNFRSFKDTQTIEFSPITLLFGPNSVGKSTILMALFYLQQIITKEQCNPTKIDAMGEKKIDGFKSLVSNGDLNSEIKIGIEFLTETTIGNEYSEYIDRISDLADLDIIEVNDLSNEAKKIKLEFLISWSFAKRNAYVREYTVTINDEFIGMLRSNEHYDKAIIKNINFSHHLINDVEIKNESSDYLYENSFHEKYNSLIGGKRADFFYKKINENYDDNSGINENSVRPVLIKGFAGALPPLGTLVQTSLETSEPENISELINNDIINRVLTQIFTSPLDKLKILLDESVSIGPIRIVPDASFKPNPYTEQKNWFNGTAAWDILYQLENNIGDGNLIEKINDWLVSEEKLNSGYKIQRKINLQEVIINNILGADEKSATYLFTPDNNAFFKKNDEPQLFFINKSNDLKLYPNQVGIGLSQILPIIVSAHIVKNGFIAIEQPELHIHPALQVALGDLFTQLQVPAVTKPMFIIETHSEHIILRLLRRVKESNNNTLPQKLKKVFPDDISVTYISDTNSGAIIKKIAVTQDGDFEFDWPNGFFEERYEEL
ncbi:AAA family ATPase [Pectobacterium brasiliense]|uniref:AAA family ATPase n=1 Tax=Pectobacterium brasiliense TaxID=180957 RepID=UPI001969FEF4|nr:AAA family ATPase [Pectobacterium brasiliense]MBN3344966.1 AAA family ATPase [Pectobacterium brasiliense]